MLDVISLEGHTKETTTRYLLTPTDGYNLRGVKKENNKCRQRCGKIGLVRMLLV